MDNSISASIYYEDPISTLKISTLEDIDIKESSMQEEPKEKAENKNPLQEDNVKFSTVQECLSPVDFPEPTSMTPFYYDGVLSKINLSTEQMKREVNQININDCGRSMIYKTKSIEEMVEQTYGYSSDLKNQMTEEAAYLQTIVCRWRRVAGDGNCFYRSTIFGWLEYLVMNAKDNVLTLMVLDLDQKFNENYPNVKRLPSSIRKNFITKDKDIVILILDIIIKQLTDKFVSNKQKRIKSAYSTLVKAFNFSRVFDTVMILYLRFLLYEFILENETKIFSKDFPVLLGNLLPGQYETENGDFLFDKYFCEDLLRFYTCAEKLAVYLSPFVLKINIKVVCYDFGTDCDIQTKEFKCYLPNKDTIMVMYRKAHYDICYSDDYIMKYIDFITMFNEDSPYIRVINVKDVQALLRKILPNVEEGSKVFNRVKKQEAINKKKEEQKKPIEENDINAKLQGLQAKINSWPKCIICTKMMNDSQNSRINKLPCGCEMLFCSEDCLKQFSERLNDIVSKGIMNKYNAFVCPKCNKIINKHTLIELVESFDEQYNGTTHTKILLRDVLTKTFKTTCMNCLNAISTENAKEIECKAKTIGYIMGSNKFKHYLCQKCRKIQISNCNICDMYHFRVAKMSK